MLKKYSYKSIISFILVVSTILMPLSFLPKKTEAQSVSGYTKGLSTTITQLPQCQDTSLKTKLLFAGTVGALGGAISGGNLKSSLIGAGASIGTTLLIDSLTPTLPEKAEEAATSIDSIATHDVSANKKLDNLNTKADKTLNNISSLKDNSTCTAAIGRIVTKMLLQKITRSTIDWIKSGFDGSPAFIQDPGKFFGDIAKNEVLQFGIEINNPQLFPFGKAWMQNTALAFNNKFQDNAQYSLNELIKQTNPQYDASTFQQDFSQGGWDAWTAMTQVPANNPLGFKLMADNEIQKRLAGTTQSVAQNTRDALQAANGFLGDQRCTDPKGVTQQEDTAGRVERSNHPNNDPDPRILKYVYLNRICNQWEYVTPGKMIADAATSTMNTTKDSLLVVQDLNDAIAAVADALLAHFSSDLMEKGFANIQTEDLTGSSDFNSSTYQSQTEKDYQPSQLSSSWLQANPDFDIRKDLTQALIDEQRTYSDKLALQNKELMSTTDGKDYKIDTTTGISNAYGLIPAIYQLDYCIPGPHPGWEEDSKKTLDEVMSLVVPETEYSIENKDKVVIVGTAKSIATIAGAAVGYSVLGTGLATTVLGFAAASSWVPVIGTVVGAAVGLLVSGIVSLFSGDSALDKLASYYATQVQALTGLKVNYEDYQDDDAGNNILSKQGMVQGINEILNRYIDRINKFYNPKLLPSVSSEEATNFYQLTGYNQIIKNNENKINLLKNTINTLGDIKTEVDKLNANYPDGGDGYESKLKVQINAFGRLSSSMVNGDDIASADNLYKQIVDKKKYVYENLLKGPYGCEKDLENKLPNGELPFQVRNTKRMAYPFPILYDYNKIAKDSSIPDPWNSGFTTNKMTFSTDGNARGPGFLSYVIYQDPAENNDSDIKKKLCTDVDPNTPDDWCMIGIRDLFPLQWGQSTIGWGASIAEILSSSSGSQLWRASSGNNKGGQFETIIGIY